MEEDRLYTIREAAELIRLGEENVRNRVRSGEIGAVFLGPRGMRIPRQEFLRWVSTLPKEETPP